MLNKHKTYSPSLVIRNAHNELPLHTHCNGYNLTGQTVTNVSENVTQAELLHFTLPVGWERKIAQTLADSVTVSCKVKHTQSIWPGNATPKYLHKTNENMSPHKDL